MVEPFLNGDLKRDDIGLSLRTLVVWNWIPVFVLYKNEVSGLFTIYPKHSGIFSSPPSKNFDEVDLVQGFLGKL